VWSAPCTRRRGARVSWLSLKTRVGEFPGLGLRTSSYGLVICASKSLRRFLDLCLKTRLAIVCQLRHKTDGRMTVRDTRRDLAACFTWKRVRPEFPSLSQNWRRSDDGWCMRHHRRGHVKMKPKTDRSMRQGGIGLFYPNFAVFIVLVSRGILVFWMSL
jgi:hypothetical protein